MTNKPLPHDSSAILVSVQAGRVARLGPQGVMSGFVKHRIDGLVRVSKHGLAGDEQADLRVHGGPDKAVYGYALTNYAIWLRDFPEHAKLLVPGAFGENLTLDGLNENSVCIGDIIRVGTVTLQVTQPRQPCFKFALRFDDRRMPAAMIRNGLCGWYYRVLEPGILIAGDRISLEVRPNPLWSIARFNRLVTTRSMSDSERSEAFSLDGLASHWRKELGAHSAKAEQ